jgi:hypothetical protein
MAEDVLDPLAKWRKPGSPSAPALVKDGEKETPGEAAHESVEGKNRAGGWLEVRPVKGAWSLLSYSELLQVDFDGENPAFIVLVFRHAMVTVRGRNLGELLAGLRTRLVAVIAQHDPQRHEPPARDAPVVESIEFTMQRPGESAATARGK